MIMMHFHAMHGGLCGKRGEVPHAWHWQGLCGSVYGAAYEHADQQIIHSALDLELEGRQRCELVVFGFKEAEYPDGRAL